MYAFGLFCIAVLNGLSVAMADNPLWLANLVVCLSLAWVSGMTSADRIIRGH